MRTHLVYLTITLAVFFQSCNILKILFDHTPKPPSPREIKKIKTVEISGILIDTLFGMDAIDPSGAVPTPKLDSLVIDLDKIDPSLLEFDKHHLKIKTRIHEESLTKGVCPDLPKPGQPYTIGALDFGVLKIKMGGREKVITDFRLAGIITIQNHTLCNGMTSPAIDSLVIRASDLRARLERLEIRIAEIMKQYPDHAADMLKPDIEAAFQDLDDIEKDLEFLRSIYITNTQKSLSRLKIDQRRMFSLEDAVDVMEEETKDPVTPPFYVAGVTLNGSSKGGFVGEVSFRTGDWVISNAQINQLKAKFWPQVKGKIRRYKMDWPEAVLDIKVKVTGYADEQPISGDLADLLFDPLSDDQQNGHSKTDRQFLNELLSGKRADALLKYFTSELGNSPKHLFTTEMEARGETPPPILKRNCPGDCPERRIAGISVLVVLKRSGQ